MVTYFWLFCCWTIKGNVRRVGSDQVLEREAVVQAVSELLYRARLGRGGNLFIIGEAGLGKTTLVQFACSLAASDVRVGLARGDVMETGLPFGLIAQLIDSLGGKDAIEAAGPFASADEARASRYYHTLRWLQALAANSPVLLALDDLHWSDGDSLALVSYLCRRIASLPVAVVSTLRPWPPRAEEVCMGLAAAGHARLDRLSALSEQAARALLVDRIGHAVAEEVVDGACTSSAGNPLLLEHLALAIGHDAASTQATTPWHAPHDVLLLGRFGGLPAAGLQLARAACVVGGRFDPGLAVALAGLGEDEAVLALDALSRSGLVRDVGALTAEFTHPLFRQALYDDLPPMVRHELHGRAFRLLLERGMEAEAAEHAVLGSLSGDAEAVAVLGRAGQSALRAGGLSTAIARLEAAVRLAGSQATPELLLLLGEARLAGGQGAEAARIYEMLIERSDLPAIARVEALRMLGRAMFITGQGARGTHRFEEAVAAAGTDRPALAVQAVLDHSRAAWLTGGPVAALLAMDRARDIAQGLDESVRMEVEAARGFVAFVAGDPTGLEAAIAAGRWAERHDAAIVRDLWWNWGTRRNSGRAAKYAERFDESESVFAAMFAQAEHIGSPQAIVSLAAHHADTLSRQGRLVEALRFATRAAALAELTPMADAFAYVVKALLLLHMGRLRESEMYCLRAEGAARVRGQWLPLLRVWHLRALRCVHEGDLGQACDLYTHLADETARLGIGEPCLVPWARNAVVAHLRAGHVDEAERVVTWVGGCAERLPCRWPRIAAGAGRASLAERRGDDDVADAEFRGALALHPEVELPIERVETLLQFGGFLRRSGRLHEARDTLREALAAAESTGARRLAQSVHAELAVAGGRRRKHHAAPESLTAQEQRVARLAAAGRGSLEIARQLSLSVRTIETHLGRIYAKLGVHSQRELMARRIDAARSAPDKERMDPS